MPPENYSFIRYLEAKKSVDDRALNQRVWRCLGRDLMQGTPHAPLRVLEVGAGVGTMFERMLEWGLLEFATYTALDLQPENISQASQRLADWGGRHAFQVSWSPGGEMIFERQASRTVLQLEAIDLFDFSAREKGKQIWDLVVAHAFLDLMNIPGVLASLFELCAPTGRYYFSLIFDGLTLLDPVIEQTLDEQIQELYHRSMDERRVRDGESGGSHSGRRMFSYLRDAGASILAAGSSDWVVFPTSGGYILDEAYFLHYIIHTIQQALSGSLELNKDRFEAWIAERHAQIERGELVYIAHQLDFIGKVDPGTKDLP
jgi:SAM-dependent methyltransferase